MVISKSNRNFESSGLFFVAYGGALIAATAVTVWMVYVSLGSTSDPPWLGIASLIFIFVIGGALFLPALLLPAVVFRLVRPWAPSGTVLWLYFPFFGAVVGYALPFVAGLLFPLPARMSAAFGLLGGIACAGLWRFAEMNPSAMVMNLERRLELRPRSVWLLAIGAVIVILAIAETSWPR
ncbi:MAG: hypothetical protein WA190_00145 [Usitatibacter sp.]